MNQTGSALRLVLEQEKNGQDRINSAKNEAAQRIATAEKDRDKIILQANSEAMAIRSAAEKKAAKDIAAFSRQSTLQREKIITAMIAKYTEIEEPLAKSIALRLISHES